MKPTRRALLIGGTATAMATATVAALPIAMGGVESFLRRVVKEHFGPDMIEVAGVDEFIRDYAGHAGSGSIAKRLGAEVYFAWRGDLVRKIGAAQELEERFLQTILTRSNVIAVFQGAAQEFQYTDNNPWEPTCGLYISALGET